MAMQLEGFEETQAKLRDLGKVEAKKVTRKALRAGAKIVRAEARSLAPVKSGNLKKNIKVKTAKRRNGVIGFIIGVGRSWFTGPAFYASFLIFGHMTGKKTSLTRHKVAPNEFMQKAYDNSKAAALDEVTDTYKELLDT